MNQTTSTLAQFDDVGARRIEAVYLTPDVVAQRQQVLQRIAPQMGERILDIGCGPGLTSQALGEAVGASGSVLAVDIAEPMLALARKRCQALPHVQLPRSLMQALQQAGFKNVQVEVMPLLNTRFDTNTYSAGMLDVMGAFVTGRDGLTAEDVAAWQADVRSMDQHTGYFFSLNRYVFVATL